MNLLFITFRFLDIIDIVLFAFLLYQLFMLIRGSVAINIFVGIVIIYLFWLLVKALDMQLLSSFLGQVIGVGVIAIIIVFQQEIRRFLLLIGSRYFRNRILFSSFFFTKETRDDQPDITAIVDACNVLSSSKTGGLIAIGRISAMDIYSETGVIMNAKISSSLIETIFYGANPLHDGAIIIRNNTIIAARCILPISQNMELPSHLGMRHRAALGITEQNDAFVIVVSEETGNISYAEYGKMFFSVSSTDLQKKLETEFPNI